MANFAFLTNHNTVKQQQQQPLGLKNSGRCWQVVAIYIGGR